MPGQQSRRTVLLLERVDERSEVGTYNCGNHADEIFTFGAPCCQEKEDNCNGKCGDSEVEFDVCGVCHDDEELHFEAKEKKEIELEESNVNLGISRQYFSAEVMREWQYQTHLINQISPLQAQIGANLLVNGPREFIVQLPRDEAKNDRAQSNDTRQCNKVWLNFRPVLGFNKVLLLEVGSRIFDLVDLDGGVDEYA
jgi:hypothetical protein